MWDWTSESDFFFQSFIRNEGSRQFPERGRPGQISAMRSVPSPGPRQSPYQGMGPPTPGTAGQGDPGPYPPSSPQQGQAPLLYQQQQQQQQPQQQQQSQQQQFRSLQRTMSAPVGMPGKPGLSISASCVARSECKPEVTALVDDTYWGTALFMPLLGGKVGGSSLTMEDHSSSYFCTSSHV